MPCCSVFWCKNRSETSSLQKDNITFHLFPKNDPTSWNIWLAACGNHISWTPKRTSTLCSQHFEDSCFIIRANKTRRLKQRALPTLKLSENPERIRISNRIHFTSIYEKKNTFLIQTVQFIRQRFSQRQSLDNADKNGKGIDNLPAETNQHMELEINASHSDTTLQPSLDPKTKTKATGKRLKQRKHSKSNKAIAAPSSAGNGARGHARPKKGPTLSITPNEKDMIFHVYKYLKSEKDLLTMINEHNICDLSLLCDILKRTADACGVTQDVVIQILREKERRMEQDKELEIIQQEVEMRREWKSKTPEYQEPNVIWTEEQPDAQAVKVEVVIETQTEIDTNNESTVFCYEHDGGQGNDETVQHCGEVNDGTQHYDDGSSTIPPFQIKLEPADIAGPFAGTTNCEQIQSEIMEIKVEPNEMDFDERITAKRRKIAENSTPIIKNVKSESALIVEPFEETTNYHEIEIKDEPIEMGFDEGITLNAKRQRND